MSGKRGLWWVLVVVAGCAHFSNQRRDFEDRLASLATTELQCPRANLHIAPASDATISGMDIPVYQRVEGCGMRATYMAKSDGYALVYLSGGSGGVDKDFGALCGSQQR